MQRLKCLVENCRTGIWPVYHDQSPVLPLLSLLFGFRTFTNSLEWTVGKIGQNVVSKLSYTVLYDSVWAHTSHSLLDRSTIQIAKRSSG